MTLAPTHAAEPRTLHIDADRTIYVVGEIDMQQTERVMKLAMAALSSNDPITIMIDSPGGLVDGGAILVKAIKALEERGLVVQCVTKNAMSMAMIILGDCTTRYALPNSRYLWHPVKAFTDGPISAEQAAALAEELSKLDNVYMPDLQAQLGMDDKTFHDAWETEKMWTAADLMKAAPGFMTPIDGVEDGSGKDFEWPQDAIRMPFRLPSFP